MVETFSASLFMDSTIGGVLAFVGFLVVFAISLASWGWLLHRAKLFERTGVWFKILRPASFVLILVGFGVLYMAGTSRLSHGDIEAVRLQHVGGERVLQVSVSWHTGGRGVSRTHKAIKVFTLEGELVGSRRTTNRSGGLGPVKIGQVGHADVLQGDGRLLIVHPLSQETLADVREALDRAHGADRYRIKGVSLPHVEVELVDGSIDQIDMRALVPAMHDLPAVTDSSLLVGGETCWAENAREDAKFDGNTFEVEGILRGRWLQHPRRTRLAQLCIVELEQPAWLVLHRSTAFGDEGAHLLSAVAVDAGEPLWSADLEPALGRLGTERYEIYSPEVRGAELCLWLVRMKRSLSELCLDARTGEIRSAKVVL